MDSQAALLIPSRGEQLFVREGFLKIEPMYEVSDLFIPFHPVLTAHLAQIPNSSESAPFDFCECARIAGSDALKLLQIPGHVFMHIQPLKVEPDANEKASLSTITPGPRVLTSRPSSSVGLKAMLEGGGPASTDLPISNNPFRTSANLSNMPQGQSLAEIFARQKLGIVADTSSRHNSADEAIAAGSEAFSRFLLEDQLTHSFRAVMELPNRAPNNAAVSYANDLFVYPRTVRFTNTLGFKHILVRVSYFSFFFFSFQLIHSPFSDVLSRH